MRHRLKELRKDLNLKQSDIYEGICSHFVYSRLENGEQEMPFELLDQFLKRMGVPLSHYLEFLEEYDSKNEFQKIEDQLVDLVAKDKLEQQIFLDTKFKYVQQNRFKNICALLVFVQVKSIVSEHLKIKVEPLTKQDLKEIEHFYQNRRYILSVDLSVLANIIGSFTCKELQPLEKLITKRIKSKKLELNYFKKLSTIYLNFIIKAIRHDNVLYAEHYLNELEQLLEHKINYYLQTQASCFKNIIEYMKTEDILYLQRAIEIVALIEHYKDRTTAASIRQEINQLLKMKKIKAPEELLIANSQNPNYLLMFE